MTPFLAGSLPFAYVDAGAGSALFQLLLAGFLGMAWMAKSTLKRWVKRFRKGKDGSDKT